MFQNILQVSRDLENIVNQYDHLIFGPEELSNTEFTRRCIHAQSRRDNLIKILEQYELNDGQFNTAYDAHKFRMTLRKSFKSSADARAVQCMALEQQMRRWIVHDKLTAHC